MSQENRRIEFRMCNVAFCIYSFEGKWVQVWTASTMPVPVSVNLNNPADCGVVVPPVVSPIQPGSQAWCIDIHRPGFAGPNYQPLSVNEIHAPVQMPSQWQLLNEARSFVEACAANCSSLPVKQEEQEEPDTSISDSESDKEEDDGDGGDYYDTDGEYYPEGSDEDDDGTDCEGCSYDQYPEGSDEGVSVGSGSSSDGEDDDNYYQWDSSEDQDADDDAVVIYAPIPVRPVSQYPPPHDSDSDSESEGFVETASSERDEGSDGVVDPNHPETPLVEDGSDEGESDEDDYSCEDEFYGDDYSDDSTIEYDQDYEIGVDDCPYYDNYY